MKSDEKQLQGRGFLTEAIADEYREKSTEELCKLFTSVIPLERTAAIRLLSERYQKEGLWNQEFVQKLLQRLCVEKALYTRMEICECLEKAKDCMLTAANMIPYLGKVGNNQIRELPKEASKKKSYPLPRDMIARSLGRMDTAIAPLLYEVLQCGEQEKISEVLDAIGYMIFYHQELATTEYARPIYEIVDSRQSSDIVKWKAIMCLSAFPMEETRYRLKAYLSEETVLGKEAKRSLTMLERWMR